MKYLKRFMLFESRLTPELKELIDTGDEYYITTAFIMAEGEGQETLDQLVEYYVTGLRKSMMDKLLELGNSFYFDKVSVDPISNAITLEYEPYLQDNFDIIIDRSYFRRSNRKGVPTYWGKVLITPEFREIDSLFLNGPRAVDDSELIEGFRVEVEANVKIDDDDWRGHYTLDKFIPTPEISSGINFWQWVEKMVFDKYIDIEEVGDLDLVEEEYNKWFRKNYD